MDWVTKLSLSFYPLAVLLIIYWAFDRKSGRKMFLGLALGRLVNGFLKLVVCAYRPWIRDARILPYGDSKVAATGYSFPSGHSTLATVYYGSIGYWFRKRNKAVTVVMFIMIALTMFSRNYLGVHTPQDVLVGFSASVLMLIAANYLENWSDKDPDKRDVIIMVTGLVICVACGFFYFLKPYPMDYTADGKLLVDPMKMLPDSFDGIGLVAAYVICRYFERRGFDFENELDWKDRFFIGTIALIPAMWWNNHIVNIFAGMNLRFVGKFFWGSGLMVYAMIIVPAVMKRYKNKK